MSFKLQEPWEQLPLELFLLILEHLPLNYVWRLRSVCNAWQHSLSSQSAEELSCRRHETHVNTTDLQLVRRKALLRAHYIGRPVGIHCIYDTNLASAQIEPLLYGDRLACVRADGSVMLMDLPTGKQSTHWSDDDVVLICLTSELLSYATGSNVHVVAKSGVQLVIPLPGGLTVQHLAGEGDLLVLLGDTFEGDCLTIIRDQAIELLLLHNQWPEGWPWTRPLKALLVEGLACHILIHWRVEDPELDQYGKDCLRIVSVNLETKTQTLQDIWYKGEQVEHSGNDFQDRMTVRSVGLPGVYHVMIRPHSVSPVPHDLLLSIKRSITLEVIHNGNETLAIWKDKLYKCPRHPEFLIGDDSTLIGISKLRAARLGWIIVPDETINEYLQCRLLINEHYLVLVTTGAGNVVYTFDETDRPTLWPAVDIVGENGHGWVDARSIIH